MTIDPSKTLGKVICDKEFHYTNELCMLYALGIGFSRDPLNEEDLKFTYELDDDFTTFSTISVLSALTFTPRLRNLPGFPEFNYMMLLHGEQITEVMKPIEPDSYVRCVSTVVDIADKVKGALLTVK